MLTLLALLAGDCHGTAFGWEASIDEARKRAEREGRLVLALHISGHFDDPALT
ncbi:MAG TPA: hypothetical protein VF950_24425 [Planctomycetota bacterium]